MITLLEQKQEKCKYVFVVNNGKREGFYGPYFLKQGEVKEMTEKIRENIQEIFDLIGASPEFTVKPLSFFGLVYMKSGNKQVEEINYLP